MTKWLPTLQKTDRPLYIGIADAIEAGISNGDLPSGAKLPPLRNIAYDIGVTVGTVSRAYALACERGLVSGEVGRGTFVLGKETPYLPPLSLPQEMVGEALQQRINKPVASLGYSSAVDIGQSKLIADIAGSIANGHSVKIMDYVRHVPNEWRQAGQEWLGDKNWRPNIEDVVPTNGTHAAIVGIISAVTSPGDKIAFEGLTYSAIARAAALLGRRIVTMTSDDFGVIPESFEKICAQQHPKLVYLMPSVQNPTLVKLSTERRKKIAEIAHKYNVYIIEDAIYAPLVEDENLPMAHFAPELTFTVGGLSKSVSAGIRAGWAACPPRYATRIANAHKMVTGGAPYWLTELASKLVLSGEACHIRKLVKEENKKRVDIVRKHLGNHMFASQDTCPYIWLTLPDPWLSGTFKKALEEHQIVVSDEDEFKPARSANSYHAIRIAFSSPETAEELNAPLKIISALLDSGFASFNNNG